MAGTLPGIANTQRVDGQGAPLVGGKLFVYKAGTITPAATFADFNLSLGQELPFPLVLDAFGQIPDFYLADGFYRARLTNASGGTVIFDRAQLPAVGNDTSGGGTPPTVDATTIFQTGDTFWTAKSGNRTGWVRANARTIGSASSGASERANNDTQALFDYLWNNYSDAICPVPGSRGASSAADWAANKVITLFDLRGRTNIGADDMGNSSAGRIADTSYTTPTTIGTAGGSAQLTLTQAQLPAIKPPITITDPGHAHSENTISTGGTIIDIAGGAGQVLKSDATDAAITGITAAFTNNLGSGAAINKMPPGMIGTWYMKL